MWGLARAYFKRFSRFREVEAALRDRQAFELQSRQEIQSHQLSRFNELWQFACLKVPYYQKLQTQHELPQSFGSLADISQTVPLLEKSAIQADPKLFLPDQYSPGFWTGTSGSTGTPMDCYWGNRGYIESQRDKYYCQQLWGIGVWDKTANLWGYSRFKGADLEGKLKYLKVRISEKIRNKMAFPVYSINRDRLRDWYSQIEQKHIEFLYALPNLAYLLAKANEDRSPPRGLKLVMVGGEPLFPHQQQLIETVLGCSVAIEYGTIEAGLIAASYPDSKLHVCERGVLLEALPRPDGLFELVVTNLRNPDFPLIRYRIGDLIDTPISLPAKGTATISAVMGRIRDVFISASGSIINGVELSEFFRDFAEIVQYQVVQETLDHVVVRLVCWRSLNETIKNTIRLKFAQTLGPRTTVEIHEVEKIETGTAGKHRFIMSKVAPGYVNKLSDSP
ncbi:MAG: phenylacetate--CoA ligase family protein [Acaryochloris sp. RU_4_1]|nr:phenylacetate--CoA ligase family protein [Acaryochloris sp. RU_4_1]